MESASVYLHFHLLKMAKDSGCVRQVIPPAWYSEGKGL